MSKLFSTGICKKLCGEPNCTSWVVGKEDKLKYKEKEIIIVIITTGYIVEINNLNK